MNRQFLTIGFLAIAFIFALVLGSNVAAGDYETLSGYAIFALVIYFIVNGWKNVWWVTSLLAFSGVVFSQGFIFEGYHLFALMIFLASGISLFGGGDFSKPLLIKRINRNGLLFFPLCFVIYGILHFFLNMTFPYSPAEYSIKTSAKAYFYAFIPMACAVWLLIGPYGFRLKENWIKWFLTILFVGLLLNIIVRGYMYGKGFQSTGPGDIDAESYFLYVPVINMQAGTYTLRWLSPLAMGLAFSFMTLPGWFRTQSRVIRWLTVLTIFLAPVGAILSGGRAVILFCFALVVVIALMRRRIAAVFTGFAAICVLIMLINMFSGFINNNAPLYVARSMQLVMFEKGDAYETISGSQDTRNLGVEAGLAAWKESPRTLLSGRSVLKVSAEEMEYMLRYIGAAGFADLAARTGSTHNLVSDLLVQYGVLGLVFYYGAFISLALYFRRMAKNLPPEMASSRAICDFMQAYLPMLLFYHSLGGGWLPVYVPLFLGLIRADLLREGGRGRG